MVYYTSTYVYCIPSYTNTHHDYNTVTLHQIKHLPSAHSRTLYTVYTLFTLISSEYFSLSLEVYDTFEEVIKFSDIKLIIIS